MELKTYPPLETLNVEKLNNFDATTRSVITAEMILRNQQKIYAVLTELATKFNFEHDYYQSPNNVVALSNR